MKFSEKIVSLRKTNGLSQEDLANKINVTRQTVSKWEQDQTVPDMNKLKEISRVFNISIDRLVDNVDFNESSNKNSFFNKNKKMYRIENGKILAGVCGGIAEYFGIDATLIRLGWIFLTLLFGTGIFVYILAVIIMPAE